MDNQIHFDDNFFFLNNQIRLLSDGLKLSLDEDFFWNPYLDMINYIDSTLISLFSVLKENEKLIQRAEYFHNLLKVQNTFLDFLNTLLDKENNFSSSINPQKELLKAIRQVHLTNTDLIRSQIKELSSQDDTSSDVITPQELALLTEPDEDLTKNHR